MNRVFSIIPKREDGSVVSHLAATRVDQNVAIRRSESIQALIQQAKEIGLAESIIEAMNEARDDYAQQNMTTTEREKVRNVLCRKDLGYCGAYIGKSGINFTYGAKTTTVADPVEAFQTVLKSLNDVVFNGSIVLFYYDTEEEVSLNVENSNITVSNEA